MFLFPDDMMRLRSVLDAALRNIHSSSHLFKLAQDAFRLGLPGEGQRNSLLLNAALELGLQVSCYCVMVIDLCLMILKGVTHTLTIGF